MSEISETEIKSMTKEQNYIRGYEDGKSDVLDKIISEATSLKITYTDHDKDTYRRGINDVLKIINKYRTESDNCN